MRRGQVLGGRRSKTPHKYPSHGNVEAFQRTCIQRRTTRERSPPIASSPLSTAHTTFSSVGEVGGSVKKGEERGVVWKESEKVVSSHELGKLLF